jgi:hypothetical protein
LQNLCIVRAESDRHLLSHVLHYSFHIIGFQEHIEGKDYQDPKMLCSMSGTDTTDLVKGEFSGRIFVRVSRERIESKCQELTTRGSSRGPQSHSSGQELPDYSSSGAPESANTFSLYVAASQRYVVSLCHCTSGVIPFSLVVQWNTSIWYSVDAI